MLGFPAALYNVGQLQELVQFDGFFRFRRSLRSSSAARYRLRFHLSLKNKKCSVEKGAFLHTALLEQSIIGNVVLPNSLLRS